MQSFYNYFSSPRYIMNQPKQVTKFYNLNEALEMGNIVKDEYIPYKNYQVKKIETFNETEQIELMIMKYEFLLHDLKLYLDTNPNFLEAKTLYENTKKGYYDYINQHNQFFEQNKDWPWEGWIK